MLELNLGNKECWSPNEEIFYYSPDDIYELEFSLKAIADWESKWHKPFLDQTEKTAEEMFDLIRFMCVGRILDPNKLSTTDVKAIQEYIASPQTATTFSSYGSEGGQGSYMSSEVFYAEMSIAGIDWQAQYWHINRLQTVLRVIADMKSEKKKMTRSEVIQQNKTLNAQRKAALKSKG